MELAAAADTLRDSRGRSRCLRGQGERDRLRDPLEDRAPDWPLAERDPRLRGTRTLHSLPCAPFTLRASAQRQARLTPTAQASTARRGGGCCTMELSLPDGGECRAAGTDCRQLSSAQAFPSDTALR